MESTICILDSIPLDLSIHTLDSRGEDAKVYTTFSNFELIDGVSEGGG